MSKQMITCRHLLSALALSALVLVMMAALNVVPVRAQDDAAAPADSGAAAAPADTGSAPAAPAPAGGDMMGTLGNAAKVGAGTSADSVQHGSNMKDAATKGGAAGVSAALKGDAPAAGAGGTGAAGTGAGGMGGAMGAGGTGSGGTGTGGTGAGGTGAAAPAAPAGDPPADENSGY